MYITLGPIRKWHCESSELFIFQDLLYFLEFDGFLVEKRLLLFIWNSEEEAEDDDDDDDSKKMFFISSPVTFTLSQSPHKSNIAQGTKQSEREYILSSEEQA